MFLVFDTESNDMLNFKLDADHPQQARIVQLAAVLVDEGLNLMDEVSMIIRPDGWKIAPGAQKAHGISLQRCFDEGRPIAEAIEAFDALAESCETLVAFNIRWDNKFIRGERRRLGRPDRFGEKREFDVMKASSPICKIPATPAMVRAGRAKQHKTPNLSQAHEILCGATFDGAHDAMADVLATLNVMRVLRDKHGVDITGEIPASFKKEEGKPDLFAAPRAPAGEAPPVATGDDIFGG